MVKSLDAPVYGSPVNLLILMSFCWVSLRSPKPT